jgi:hypothetical protein
MAYNKLPETAEHLRGFIRDAKNAADAIPAAQQQLDLIELAQMALEQRPAGAEAVSTDKLDKQSEWIYQAVRRSWPQLPEIPKNLSTTSSSSAMLGSALLTLVNDIAVKVPTPQAQQYQALVIGRYQRLEEAQTRPKQVRALLQKHFPKVGDRFVIAVNSYQGYKDGFTGRTAAANDIRNFMWGLNGELIHLARQPHEQKLAPAIIVDRLFTDAPNKADVEKQLNTEYQALIDTLSDMLKGRPSPNAQELESIWEQVLAHAYVVCTGMNRE